LRELHGEARRAGRPCRTAQRGAAALSPRPSPPQREGGPRDRVAALTAFQGPFRPRPPSAPATPRRAPRVRRHGVSRRKLQMRRAYAGTQPRRLTPAPTLTRRQLAGATSPVGRTRPVPPPPPDCEPAMPPAAAPSPVPALTAALLCDMDGTLVD